MRHLARVSLLISFLMGTLASAGFGPCSAAPKKDYFTDDELDLIRDAQELALRAPVIERTAEGRYGTEYSEASGRPHGLPRRLHALRASPGLYSGH